MLKDLSADGFLRWDCPNCGTENLSHHSHELVRFASANPEHFAAMLAGGKPEEAARSALANLGAGTIELPPCDCGARTFLKHDFTEEDLRAPNMIDEDGQSTESLAAALRHMQLAAQMDAAGKAKTP